MSQALVNALRGVLDVLMKIILGADSSEQSDSGAAKSGTRDQVQNSREELLQLVQSLSQVGLAGERLNNVTRTDVYDICHI